MLIIVYHIFPMSANTETNFSFGIKYSEFKYLQCKSNLETLFIPTTG